MKLKNIFGILIFMILLFSTTAFAQENTTEPCTIYVFYGEGCPHCKAEKEFLPTLTEKYPNLEIEMIEVWKNESNRDLFMKVSEKYGIKNLGVPLTFIGEEYVIGFSSASTTGKKIESMIDKCHEDGHCMDAVAQCMGQEAIPEKPKEEKLWEETVKVPFMGEVRVSSLSLPSLTILLGLLDGFNPCAMWVLMFMLALLVNTQDKKLIWKIGGTFIVVSGIVYYAFMAAWLNAFLFVGYIMVTRVIIGLLAIGAGVYYTQDAIRNPPGVCKTSGKSKMKIMNRIEKLVKPGVIPATFLGIVALAFTVNLIELLCSVGLPAIYTRVLALSNISTASYYLYLGGYTFFYMLDDLIMFLIVVKTMEVAGFSGKTSKYIHIFGGLLLALLGLLMIFKPEALMFG